jgi:Ca2+-transporting ATPase
MRDGVMQRIAGAEVVVDDVMVLSEGSRVAADAKILESHHLHQDESLLTGESIPVSKKIGDTVYSGCMITQGSGLAKVSAIGGHTQIGQIGKSLKTIKVPNSPLQNEMRVLMIRFAVPTF